MSNKIGDDWGDRWDTLSHGERKRLQIASAIWTRPAVLALDEPFNHLDTDGRSLLISSMREYQGCGLLVSHDRVFLNNTTNIQWDIRDRKLSVTVKP